MPLGNLLVVLLLLRSLKLDKEGFLVMALMTIGGYALTNPAAGQWGFNIVYLVALIGVVGICVLRKTRRLKQVLFLYGAYAVVSVALALASEASLREQLVPLLGYLGFFAFTIPLMVFSGERFDMDRFWNRAFSFAMIVAVFYILDAYVIRGWVLIPCSTLPNPDNPSTFLSPIINGPFGWIPRKYPPGLYVWLLLLYPLARRYRLKWWQLAIFVTALICTKTFSVISGFIVGYIIAMGSFRKYITYGLSAVALFAVLYAVDFSMGFHGEENNQSTLRIASSINQLIALDEVEDDEDLAEAGSGRMAQAIPSVISLFEDGREMTGYGLLFNLDTQDRRFLIENELMTNPELRYRLVTDVEISLVRVMLMLGIIGLAAHLLFLWGQYVIVRRLEYRAYFSTVILTLLWMGIGDFCSLATIQGVYFDAFVFAVVLLANRPVQHRNQDF